MVKVFRKNFGFHMWDLVERQRSLQHNGDLYGISRQACPLLSGRSNGLDWRTFQASLLKRTNADQGNLGWFYYSSRFCFIRCDRVDAHHDGGDSVSSESADPEGSNDMLILGETCPRYCIAIG